MARILIIEDEKKVADFLTKGLTEEGYQITVAIQGGQGQKQAINEPYELIILDRMLPDQDGIDVCHALRGQGVDIPILMLTARDAVEDRVSGLDAGADDYLVKPFAFEELLARIRVLLRRPVSKTATCLRVGDLELDLVKREVSCQDQDIVLTQREFDLLAYMMKRPGRVLSRTMIEEQVWKHDFDTGTNVVDVYINYLRKKIDMAQAAIHTVRGIGYVLKNRESP
jgi:DNA-binding response OmpR family regulator